MFAISMQSVFRTVTTNNSPPRIFSLRGGAFDDYISLSLIILCYNLLTEYHGQAALGRTSALIAAQKEKKARPPKKARGKKATA